MAVATHRPAHEKVIFTTANEWYFREEAHIPRDLNRFCKANAIIEFQRAAADVSFAVFVSAGCSHIATVEANAQDRTIKVTVWHLDEEFAEKWSTSHEAPESEFTTDGYVTSYDYGAIHGGITEDGQCVLLVYRPKGSTTRAYLVNAHGFTWRKPPSDTSLGYTISTGTLSEDSEYLFYVRSGKKFGRNGQAKVVEAYSIRHLSCVKAESFGFGDGYQMRNVCLLPHLRLQGPTYMAIDTSSFGGDDHQRNSPPLIVSSDERLHWNFAGIDSITSRGGRSCFVSPDNAHLVYVEPDAAMLHHWDLTKLSLRPLGSVRLPGVEYSTYRTWLLYGKETKMKNAIADQIHEVRYSPKCKTVTVVTVNDSMVVVNVLSTFNLQLLHHETIEDATWTEYVPLRIGFHETTGLNVFAMSPADFTRDRQGLLRLFGMKGVLIAMPEVFKKIKALEVYFDNIGERIAALPDLVDSKQVMPLAKFEWKPGIMDRNDEFSIPRTAGPTTVTNSEDARRQLDFYVNVYAHQSSSWKQDNTPELRRFFVPHLFSFTYPWAPEKRVSVFGVVMKHEYHLISIGPAASSSGSGMDIVRVLYATDIKISQDEMEHIEIYDLEGRYVLRVYTMREGCSSYSGAPMPIPRWTLMSPHFLEEDAWYDTFVIHRSAHVTMPGGWSTTPNQAISSSTNMYAYFQPNTLVVQDEINYGLRTRSAYVLPKYLLWKEFGLRGLRKGNPNDMFFGGGRYADTLGPYFRSIYDDRAYDDANPLFPSTFALACNSDYRSQQTIHIDAFFRRIRQDRIRLLDNSVTVTCALPIACRARPGATLSFMRFVALYPWAVIDVGAVQVKRGATKAKAVDYGNEWYKWRRRVEVIWRYIHMLFGVSTKVVESEPNKQLLTLPLPGFCSFGNKLYKPPPVGASFPSDRDDPFWSFVLATTPYSKEKFPRWESRLQTSVAESGKGPASPFTRLVEEILEMKDRDLQLTYLKVVWLGKLLAWKMRTFGLKIYLTRTALPMLVLFVIHLAVGILLTGGDGRTEDRIGRLVILLATIEAAASCFILSVKLRQAYRIPRQFFRSIFTYVDGAALSLGLAMFFQIATGHAPQRAFLGFSTLLIWIAAILMLRIYKPVGMLLLLLTETIQEIFSFLVLLFFIILGFAFVPFLLLRNTEGTDSALNPFSNFAMSFANILNFISSDYGALEAFEDSAAVRTLRALYIIIITVLFLNILIAMLNLKIKIADKNAANLYHLQMASLQIEIELGLLSASERRRRDWFPQWFNYSMTETETRLWEDYVEKNKLKWDEDNNFDETKDNAPPPRPLPRPLPDDWAGPPKGQLPATSTTADEDDVWATTPNVDVAAEAETPPLPQSASSPSSSATRQPSNATPAPSRSESQLQSQSQPQPPPPTTAPSPSAQPAAASASASSSATTADSSSASPGIEGTLACNVCGAPGKRCTGCRKVAYCRREHQRADWKTHMAVCKKG
ncbi:uncharacterized protein A1O5_07430 [Cladophialophora psammophila CBS 110553]|uniref:MYND-type domain-containing protein n=1 Tax=Cladophialophora psammophila CBS 110553 TaxID=1182543 RepID=W9XGA3_9EURO|nr:uncharacterized protein A1O5_07430 [Cladophialophora psammophila CBS 110553]EXJ69394.1 hypothetical protein A1O5_07430 [Cladophialophora psammophila CBS 110553]